MRIQWKLIALAVLALVALGVLVLPIAPPVIPSDAVHVNVEIRSGDFIDEADPWLVKAILVAFGLLMLGVLGWVFRHIHRRDREPDA